MKKVKVDASISYDVLIERGLINKSGKLIRDIAVGEKVVIISDSNVFPLYGETLKASLIEVGFSVAEFVFPAGESSKNTETLVNIWEFLAENHITRSDTLIALGGGVPGDITGFAAATFLRGIKYIQIPTTLLAMVDSSVGGKTAVDLKAGKNLAGTFYQPSIVLCDPDALKTLPESIFSDGMAEVIKYGMINQPDLLYMLQGEPDIADIIEICVSDKRDIVNLDEKDLGLRQLLNFGHTAAHGIELCSDFNISHGSAVAIGMMIMTKASIKAGLCSPSCISILSSLLNKYNLPTSCEFSCEDICKAALNDKKRSGSFITLVIPEEIGKCSLQKIPVSSLLNFLSGAWKK